MIQVNQINEYINITVTGITQDIVITVTDLTEVTNIQVADIGIKGDKGIQGLSGVTGLQGLIGPVGAPGAPGPPGIQGLSGAQGLIGATGLSGATGSAGAQGLSGATGSAGAQGIQGVAGATGTQGIQGTTGLSGTTGAQGIQGLSGATGAQGIAGTQGIQGIQGLSGATGASGSSIPSGLDMQIQYNDNGVLGADADFVWNKVTNDLILTGIDAGIILGVITTEPPVPAVGTLQIYSKLIAGKGVLKVKGPSGLDFPLQTAFWQNNITMWNPTTATAGVWLGTIGSGAGTYSTALPTITSVYTSIKRGRWANVVTTANQVLGIRNAELMYTRGAVASQGGFFFYARVGMDVWTNGGRFFAGMHTATTVISADPSALNNTVGFCVDAADNGLISFLTRGTVATKASTGFTIVSNKGYDVYMFCSPNSNQIEWKILDINSGVEATGIATTNLPANTTLFTAGVLASNAAITPVTSINLGLNRIYVETDY